VPPQTSMATYFMTKVLLVCFKLSVFLVTMLAIIMSVFDILGHFIFRLNLSFYVRQLC